MKEYHKIQSLFKRDMQNHGKLIHGQWSMPEFEYLQNNLWEFTEKVDGTNIRVMWDGTKISFGGKTDNAQIMVSLFEKLQELFPTQVFKEIFPDISVCLYGEGYGAKIQKGGGNYSKAQEFVLFDVKIGEWWLERKDVEEIASKLGIKSVPVIGKGTLGEAIEIVRKGFNSKWGNFLAEGIVARPSIELKARSGQRIITKIKHEDFR